MYKDEFLCKVSMNYLYLNTCLKMATLQNDLIQSAVQFVHCSQVLRFVQSLISQLALLLNAINAKVPIFMKMIFSTWNINLEQVTWKVQKLQAWADKILHTDILKIVAGNLAISVKYCCQWTVAKLWHIFFTCSV